MWSFGVTTEPTVRPVRLMETSSCGRSAWRAMLARISVPRALSPFAERICLKYVRSRWASVSQKVMARLELRRSGPKKLRSSKRTPSSCTRTRGPAVC